MKCKSLLLVSALLEMTLASGPCLSANTPGYVLGDTAQQQVTKLTSEIHWYEDLNQAKQQAQHQNKLIVWIQILGRIDGAT